MDYLESARRLNGTAFRDFARMLYEYNRREYNALVAELVRGGRADEYAKIAEMSEVACASAEGAFYDGDATVSVRNIEQKYLRELITICTAAGLTESDYAPLLFAAGYADKNSALGRLNCAVEEYVKRRAADNFDGIADQIDRFDAKYIKYRVLIEVDRSRAVRRLLNKAVYEKHINKAFVRDVLMDCADAAPALFEAYKTADAHERVAIVRLLLVMKNDGRVRAFLDETVAADKSKSVRALLDEREKKRKGGAPAYFERLMADGKPLSLAQWSELLDGEEFAEVADRTFFCARENGYTRVLLYNNGEFTDLNDSAAELDAADDIYVLHPINAPAELADVFASGVEQPFLQAGRPLFHVLSGEVDCSYRFYGDMIARDAFEKNRKRIGFELCERRGGGQTVALYRVGDYCVGAELDGVGGGSVGCGKLLFFRAKDVVRVGRNIYIDGAQPLAVSDVPRREYSELAYAVRRLFTE